MLYSFTILQQQVVSNLNHLFLLLNIKDDTLKNVGKGNQIVFFKLSF